MPPPPTHSTRTVGSRTNGCEQYVDDLRSQKRPSELVYERLRQLLDQSIPVSWSLEHSTFRRPLAHDCEFGD